MPDYEPEELREWLKTNTKLSVSSMGTYMRVYQLFYEEYGDCSLKNLKEFISKKNREHNEIHHKAPWLYFFLFKGMPMDKAKALYVQLPKLRKMPIKRSGTYMPDDILYRMLLSIPDKLHRDVSLLRFHTGIRIFEALTIREELINREDLNADGRTAKMLRILIQTKGGGNRAVFLTLQIAEPILKPYIQKRPGYIFLPRFFDNLNQSDLFMKVHSETNRYNESLAMVAKEWNLNKRFSSHDLRRAFAERCRKRLKDISLVQRMMGHKRIENTIRYFEQNPADVLEASARMQGV